MTRETLVLERETLVLDQEINQREREIILEREIKATLRSDFKSQLTFKFLPTCSLSNFISSLERQPVTFAPSLSS